MRDENGRRCARGKGWMMEEKAGDGPRCPCAGWVEQAAKAVIGAAIEVHKHIGSGLLESTYEAVLIGLRRSGCPPSGPGDDPVQGRGGG